MEIAKLSRNKRKKLIRSWHKTNAHLIHERNDGFLSWFRALCRSNHERIHKIDHTTSATLGKPKAFAKSGSLIIYSAERDAKTGQRLAKCFHVGSFTDKQKHIGLPPVHAIRRDNMVFLRIPTYLSTETIKLDDDGNHISGKLEKIPSSRLLASLGILDKFVWWNTQNSKKNGLPCAYWVTSEKNWRTICEELPIFGTLLA